MSNHNDYSNSTIEQSIHFEQKDGKLNIVFDMSTYDLFELCKARFNYRHNMLKAVPINQKAKALDRGGLAHEGFEVYFNGIKEGLHFADRMQAAIKRIQFLSSDPDSCNLESEDVNIVLSAIEQSCDYWRFEDEQMEILEVEQAFAYILYEDEFIRIIITGKIDLLVNIPPMGRNVGYNSLPIDHKTYERDFEVPRLSNQFINYTYATQSNYLIVNRVGLHALSTKLTPEQRFKRVPLSYDHMMWEEWKQDVVHTILTEYISCLSEDKWTRNFTSCFSYNRKCEYYEVCESSGLEAKLFKLEGNFATVSPWDVTAKLNQNKNKEKR